MPPDTPGIASAIPMNTPLRNIINDSLMLFIILWGVVIIKNLLFFLKRIPKTLYITHTYNVSIGIFCCFFLVKTKDLNNIVLTL